jgi:hypothetical protein
VFAPADVPVPLTECVCAVSVPAVVVDEESLKEWLCDVLLPTLVVKVSLSTLWL